MSAALAFPPQIIPPRKQVWLSMDQMCELTGWHPVHVRRLAAQGKLASRDSGQRSANGRTHKEFLTDSLPEQFRTKLSPPVPQVLEMRPARPSQDIAPLFAPVVPEQPGRRISLDPKAERQAAARYAVIEPLLNYGGHPANKARFAALRLADGRAVKTADLLAEYIAETCTVDGKRVSRPTLWRWVKQYREGDRVALARKVNSNKGTSPFFAKYPEAGQLAASIYLKPGATFARAYDAIRRDRELLGIPADELPSIKTVRNYCESIPKALSTLSRDGRRAYDERFSPFVQRAYTDIPANDLWVSDIQTHDVEVRNDCFPGVAKDAPLRLKFVCIMDMRSRKIVGYAWCVDGDWRAIATALRNAVERYGPPVTFYMDNGADFGKVGAGAKRIGERRKASRDEAERNRQELERNGPLRQLGIQVTECIPYNAQAKPIERLFRTVHGRLDALWAGYLTGTPFTRPDAATVMGIEHRKLVKFGRGSESMLPPASAFIRIAQEYVENDYNALHEHSGRGMDGNTPNAVYDALYPLQTRRKADPDVLNMLLFERDSRKVDAGAIALTIAGEKRRYMPAPHDHAGWGTMHGYGQGKVDIAYDALNPDRVIVLDARGCKACELWPEVYTTQSHGLDAAADAQTAIQIAATLQTRNRLRKATAQTVQQIDRAVALRGHKTELQIIAEHAAASAPADLISHKATPKVRPNNTDSAPLYAHDVAARVMQRKAAK